MRFSMNFYQIFILLPYSYHRVPVLTAWQLKSHGAGEGTHCEVGTANSRRKACFRHRRYVVEGNGTCLIGCEARCQGVIEVASGGASFRVA